MKRIALTNILAHLLGEEEEEEEEEEDRGSRGHKDRAGATV